MTEPSNEALTIGSLITERIEKNNIDPAWEIANALDQFGAEKFAAGAEAAAKACDEAESSNRKWATDKDDPLLTAAQQCRALAQEIRAILPPANPDTKGNAT